MHLSLIAALTLTAAPSTSDEGPLVRALWLVQRYGTADAVVPFEHGQALAAAAPNGRLVPLEGHPHRIDLVSLAAPIAGALEQAAVIRES